ncbi:DUF4350 domain-containing protein [Haloarcula laminariae]|uniref:DUF4350 domain-containing protein n=1 Tax=Haloarcula laminariae TaxID=2961577 RepID=UPI0021C9BAB2|nr:DUF4350 domain-containing protein [Halomicroarcula laminariae]
MEWQDYPRVALIILFLVTNVGLVTAMSTSTAAYGPYNSAWDGGTELRDQTRSAGAEPKIATSTSAYVDSGADSVAFVIAPTATYNAADIARLRQFVSRGGTLVVAGEGTNATNDLLGGLDVETRLNGTRVRDDQSNYRNASLPRATNVSEHSLVNDTDALTLNRGTVLDVPERDVTDNPADRPTVLIRTASSAYLDTNGNGTLDDTESVGSYPVAVTEPVGSGRVIVVSDASVFTNAMLEQEGNAAFTRAVSRNATTALLDYSHRPPLPALTYVLLVIRSTPAAQALLAAVVLGIIALWARRPAVRVPESLRSLVGDDQPAVDTTLTEADVTEFVRERHPEWDGDRIERVSQHIIRRREE